MVPFQDDRSMVQSLFSRIMAAARERSAVTMRRFLDGHGDFDSDDDDDDDEDDDDHILLFDLSRPVPRNVNNSAVQIPPGFNPTPLAPPKHTRSKHPRKNQKDSLWYRDYLTPALRAELTLHPHDRLAAIFRRNFHAPIAFFSKIGAACKR